jgi:ABC-type uncharacterized transport system substrate-binding protein
MRRRDVIRGIAGSAAAWSLVARAQQREKMRRIGVLMSQSADDPDALAWIAAFAQGLQERGWSVGGNVRIDYRWGAGDVERFRKSAAELVALAPDVVLATAGSIVGAFQQASRTRPDCVRDDNRSGRRRMGREPVSTGHQRHRICLRRIQHEGQMAGTAQGDRARR